MSSSLEINSTVLLKYAMNLISEIVFIPPDEHQSMLIHTNLHACIQGDGKFIGNHKQMG